MSVTPDSDFVDAYMNWDLIGADVTPRISRTRLGRGFWTAVRTVWAWYERRFLL